MAKQKVFCTRKIPEEGLSLLSEQFDLKVWQGKLPPTREELLENSRDCHALLSLLSDRIDEDFLNNCPNLKVISNYAVGYNNIDVEAADKRNIKVGNTPDVLTDATADIAAALLFSCARLIQPAIINAKQGEWKTWEPLGFIGKDLRNKTLGVVGAGRIGFSFAKAMHFGFNMNVIYFSRTKNEKFENELNASQVSLEEIASNSDFISLHCPLNENTKNLINEEFFSKTKSHAILINTARGEIIDQNALVNALKSKKLFAAGLDVTSPEPLPKNHELFNLDNCIVLPHIGSATEQARIKMSLICAENITKGLNGQKLPHEVLK